MTIKQVRQVIDDTNSKDLVLKILDELNGESYLDAKKILDVVKYFVESHSYVDKDMAHSLIDTQLGDNDG